MDLSNSSAVVTGGGNGIGRALCFALAEEGVNVAVADIDEKAANAVAEELARFKVKAFAVGCDVASTESTQNLSNRAISEFNSVELLFNNAGVIPDASPLLETDVGDVEWIFKVNVLGVINCIRAFSAHFEAASKEVRIVNTASEHALGVPHNGISSYTASKHAILGLSDVLRREAPEHIKVSVLCPGIVATSLWRANERRQDEFGGPSDSNEMVGQLMQNVGMPPEVIARKTIDGIKRGDFYIVTHSHVIEYAEERFRDIEQAFATQAPREEGDEKYDLRQFTSRTDGSNTDS